MSALAGVFGPASASSLAVLQDMLGAMRNRASGTPEFASADGAHIAAARHEWEAAVSGWRGPLIAHNEDWIVAADATLYYLSDLRRDLRLTSGDVDTGAILLRALRMWGDKFAQRLEGDYAIVAWDRRRNRVLLARDFGGRRSLAYATAGGSTIVASSAGAVVRHPDVSTDYDRGFIAASASFVFGPGHRTAYRQVSMVPPGVTLSIDGGSICEVDRWSPPPVGFDWEREPSGAAAEELRHLLFKATRERLDPSGPTTVWMSGGWDSPSVFASACAALDAARIDRSQLPVLPVSLTYPADDLGNEDHHINAIAARWGVPVTWIEADRIPLIEDAEERALKHDDPMIQPFEGQMRHLARATRRLGARIALDGFGGDNIFHASSAAVLADHFFFGRWAALWREWKTWSGSARSFARLTLLPHLSEGTRDWLQAVRGRSLEGFWDREFPPWIMRDKDILAELAPEVERMADESASQYELRRGLLGSLSGRAVSWNVAFGLDEGVQLRAPLFDRRVVAFSVSRPLSDRGAGGDSKRLLRTAMAGLIPDSVLAPRGRKTGTPAGYFRRQFAGLIQPEVDTLFRSRPSNLEKLGVLEHQTFMDSVHQYVNKEVHVLGALLHQTMCVERWLAVRANRK